MRLFGLICLAGCAPTLPLVVEESSSKPEKSDSGIMDSGSFGSDGGDGSDGGGLDGGDGGGETGDPGPPDDSSLFQLDTIHRIELDLEDGAVDALNADPYSYVRADLRINGEAFPNVGARIKGRLGSLRNFPGKSAWKIDLLEFGEDKRLFGHEKLNLNNMVQDCAKVKEYYAYGAHRLLGTPAPRVAYAQVWVEGDYYGLYSLVENYDDEFLKRHMEDPSGNLYDGDYYLLPDWSYYLVDFNIWYQDYFELDEGVDVGLADIHAVTEVVDRSFGGDLTELRGVLDVSQHAKFLAVNAWTGQWDSYSYYSNNYRVYFDPARGGRATFLPWDPDWAFDSSAPGGPGGYGVVSALCFTEAVCTREFLDALDQLHRGVPASELEEDVSRAAELIRDVALADPWSETSSGDMEWCQDSLARWAERRPGEMAAMGLE